MADETLTLALHGEVSLDTFAEAMERWRRLVANLSGACAGGDQSVHWVIDDLSAGSATATIRSIAESPDAAAPILEGYAEVGQALRDGRPDLVDSSVRGEAYALLGLLHDPSLDFLRLETAEQDFIVSNGGIEIPAPMQRRLVAFPAALGGVEGRIQTLSSRGGLRFTLYDAFFDKAVGCYLAEGQEEIMRDIWGTNAMVEGSVTRDPESGRPLNIRHVWNVTPLGSQEASSYLAARGALSVAQTDRRSAEDLIAASRDG